MPAFTDDDESGFLESPDSLLRAYTRDSGHRSDYDLCLGHFQRGTFI